MSFLEDSNRGVTNGTLNGQAKLKPKGRVAGPLVAKIKLANAVADEMLPSMTHAELAVWLASERSQPVRGRLVSVHDTWWRDPEKMRQVEQTVHLYRMRRHEP